MNLVTLSWKNLTSKPLSMLMSIVLFALGVGLVSLLLLVDKQVQDNFEKNLAGIDLVIGAKGSPLQLILSSMYHIDAPTGNIALQEAKPFLNPKHPLIKQAIPLALGDSYRTFRIVGTEQGFSEMYNGELAEGKMWSKNFEVVVGDKVKRDLELQIGDEFSSSHGFQEDENLEHDHEEPFVVVGSLKPTGSVIDQLILTSVQSFWHVHGYEDPEAEEDHDHSDHDHAAHDHDHRAHDHGHDTLKSLYEESAEQDITALLVQFKARNYQALNMQRSINENTDMQAATPAIEINRLFSLMSTGERALRILAFVIILVSGLSIFISLYSSLKRRKYELALMRVMGAHPSNIFILIIMEGLLLALIGFVVGILLSHLGIEIFSNSVENANRYSFTGFKFLKQEWFLLLGALLIGFLAALIPGIRASRTDSADTLTKA